MVDYKWLGVTKGMRPPTEVEALALRNCLLESYGIKSDPETIDCDKFIGICDSYITDGPGYAGPVAIIVWPASPTAITVLTRKDVGRGAPLGEWTIEKDFPC